MNREIKLFMRQLLGPVAIVLAVASVPASTALAQADIQLTGVFNIIWGDTGPGVPPGFSTEPVYMLVDDAGRFFTLDSDSVEELTREEGGPLQFNRERVQITGMLDPQTNTVQVLSIEPQIIIPLQPTHESHIWGDHRSGSQEWITVLCRFADSTDVTPEPDTFFDDLMGFMDDYWRELSYDKINLSGSQVVGWFNLPQNRMAYLDHPAPQFPGHTLNFQEIAEDCTAAADSVVNFPDFNGINLIFNQDLDCCSWGGGTTLTRDGVNNTYAATWMATWGWGNQDVLGQEMGHGFGLPHSSGPYTSTYDSQWDVQSGGGTCSPSDARFGCIGVHTIGLHKDALGWIEDARRYVATADPNQSIFIERLAQSGTNGFLEAQIPIGGSTTNFYTVEARNFVGFDDQVPGEAVIIHRVDTTLGDRQAKVVDPDGDGDPNDAGAQWLPGEVFEDVVNNITVCVTEETETGFRVVINCTPPSANLLVDKSDSPDPVTVGDNLTYTISVSNIGPDNATDVTLTDALPAAVNFVSATPSGSCSGTTSITCNLGNLAAGASAPVEIVVTPTTAAIGTIINTATVTGRQADPDETNNMVTEDTTVNPQVVTVVCAGQTRTPDCTVNSLPNQPCQGTSGPDTIIGTAGRDVIHGLEGRDIIRGRRGGDTICGGRGNDSLFGHRGGDLLLGQRGNDALNGGRGTDTCMGGRGNDSVVNCE